MPPWAPMLRRTSSLVLFALVAACATSPETAPVLALRAAAGQPFAAAVRIQVQVSGPAGERAEANGEVGAGGTTRALASSLARSLRSYGCVVRVTDAQSGGSPLSAAMQQLVILPAGWSASLPVRVEQRDAANAAWIAPEELEVVAADLPR